MILNQCSSSSSLHTLNTLENLNVLRGGFSGQ